jgi:hypothetical protein
MIRFYSLLKRIFQRFFTSKPKELPQDVKDKIAILLNNQKSYFTTTRGINVTNSAFNPQQLLKVTRIGTAQSYPSATGFTLSSLFDDSDEVLLDDSILIFQTKRYSYYKYKDVHFRLPKVKDISYIISDSSTLSRIEDRYIMTDNERYEKYLKFNYPEFFYI